jgi:hypothetical protein
MRHAGPLAAAAGLLIGGAYTYAAEETVTGVSLLAAGLITLGAWIAVEVRTDRKDNTDG